MTEPGTLLPRRRVDGALVALLFLLTGVVGVAYGAGVRMPPLASRHGAGIDAMLAYLLATAGALFLVGHIVLALLIWRGARRDRVSRRLARPATEWRLSIGLGLLVTVVGEAGVLAIGIPVWNEYFVASPPANAVLIEVTGQQFMWNVRYPGPDGRFGATNPRLVDDASNPLGRDPEDPAGADDVTLLNEIAVEVDRPVRVRLRSRDVIHSFFLPHLRVKQDAVPGMSPEVVFVPTREGSYEIACTELCGLGHYRMQGTLRVLGREAFERWIKEQAGGS
jgi:cytochrome c oxidase subunit 2